jgi:hypothetical protein
MLVGHGVSLSPTTIVGHRFNCGTLELLFVKNTSKTDPRD